MVGGNLQGYPYRVTFRTRNLTDGDRAAAENLKRIWREKRSRGGPTQAKIAELMGERSQGLVSQYMTGRIKLGRVAVLKFARILQVDPTEIRPDFDYQGIPPDELDPYVLELAVKLASLHPLMRDDVARTIELYSASQTYPELLKRLVANRGKPAAVVPG